MSLRGQTQRCVHDGVPWLQQEHWVSCPENLSPDRTEECHLLWFGLCLFPRQLGSKCHIFL